MHYLIYVAFIAVAALSTLCQSVLLGALDVPYMMSSISSSGAFSTTNIIIICCVGEALGSMLFGQYVSTTMSAGLVKFVTSSEGPFQHETHLKEFMTGSICILISSSICIVFGMIISVPMSVTHSSLAAFFTILLIYWNSTSLSLDEISAINFLNLTWIVLNWIFMCSVVMLVSMAFWHVFKKYIVGDVSSSLTTYSPPKRMVAIFSPLLAAIIGIATFMVTYYASPTIISLIYSLLDLFQISSKSSPTPISYSISFFAALMTSTVAGAVVFVFSWVIVGPHIEKKIERECQSFLELQETSVKVNRLQTGKKQEMAATLNKFNIEHALEEDSDYFQSDDDELVLNNPPAISPLHYVGGTGLELKTSPRSPTSVSKAVSPRNDTKLTTASKQDQQTPPTPRSTGSAEVAITIPSHQSAMIKPAPFSSAGVFPKRTLYSSDEDDEDSLMVMAGHHDPSDTDDDKSLDVEVDMLIQTQKNHAEVAEKIVFGILLFFTILALSIAHGSSDGAIATGPFYTVYYAIIHDRIPSDSRANGEGMPVWLLAVQAVGLIFGLVALSSRLLERNALNLPKTTPARAFISQFTSMCAVWISAAWGLPIHTLSVVTASALGVHLADLEFSFREFRWRLAIGILASWTLSIVGGAVVGLSTFGLMRLILR